MLKKELKETLGLYVPSMWRGSQILDRDAERMTVINPFDLDPRNYGERRLEFAPHEHVRSASEVSADRNVVIDVESPLDEFALAALRLSTEFGSPNLKPRYEAAIVGSVQSRIREAGRFVIEAYQHRPNGYITPAERVVVNELHPHFSYFQQPTIRAAVKINSEHGWDRGELGAVPEDRYGIYETIDS